MPAPIIAVAPMMDCTDRHDRYFLRLIAPDARLYTEMITSQAIIHGHWQHLLAYDHAERYLALQLGGNEPQQLAQCAEIGESCGYDEINLNVGCPSSRVKSGRFGACLMLQPALVADCAAAMTAKVKIPITVKCRTGVDDVDHYENLHYFIHQIAQAGVKTVIVHARKALLAGLSPKENREIPPLDYAKVYQLKKDFPTLTILINGGIKTIPDIVSHLAQVDGVMIGREAYAHPYFLADVQAHFFSKTPILTRSEIIEKMLPYIEEQLKNGIRLSSITRHLLGIFHQQRGAAHWRRYLSMNAHKKNDISIIVEALALVNGL